MTARILRRLLVFVAALGLVMLVLASGFGRWVDRVAIRDSGFIPASVGDPAFVVPVDGGIDMPVYSAGRLVAGCVVFFPGQHGLDSGLESRMAPLLASRGVASFTAAYAASPHGAVLSLKQTEAYAGRVVEEVEKRCGRKYVVVGRSLGAMVAAYSVRDRQPAALLLEGASPSLAAALRASLLARLGRRVVDLLPLESLLAKNYTLLDALGPRRRFPVTLIQGCHDSRTPIADLMQPGAIPPWIDVVPVENADHRSAGLVFMPQYLERIEEALHNAGP